MTDTRTGSAVKTGGPFAIGLVVAAVDRVPLAVDPEGNFLGILQYDDVLAYRPRKSP